MSNIFKQRTDFVNKPNRTTKDLSFQNNISLEVGRLTPTLIQEGLPGQSFHIDAAAGIRAMPMVFPIQTPLRFHTYFFKVPLRIMCDEWEDFITGVKQTNPMPYHDFSDSDFAKSFLRTGGLGDYLGIPTSVVGENMSLVNASHGGYLFGAIPTSSLSSFSFQDSIDLMRNQTLTTVTKPIIPDNYTFVLAAYDISHYDFSQPFRLPTNLVQVPTGSVLRVKFWQVSDSSSTHLDDALITSLDDGYFILSCGGDYSNRDNLYMVFHRQWSNGEPSFPNPILNSGELGVPMQYQQFSNVDAIDERVFSLNPFVTGDIRLSAFPARAYEMCYNYFFRNEMNDPFLVNGQPEYNKYLPSQSAGADSYPYHFHYRNWELDQFTSAVQSPQFGIAPLVGVTVSPSSSSADLHFGSTTVTNPDGTTQTLADSTMKVGIDVSTGKINNIVNADGVPSGNLHTIMDAIGYGISINDFRNVNSFQRYLENAIARGYKYRDQMLSHFGVDVGYPDIQVPEMIGAFSCDFNVNQINQTVGTSESPLGDYAGQGNFIGSTQRTISTYCHEHCIIIGISCLVPVPVYTQTLPKVFLRESRFDWFTPEFSKIGYQPIFNKEIAPLQVSISNEHQDGVFGYNRAWYDYLARLDEAHGLFRLSLKDFIMMRQFGGVPYLGQNFLKIDPEQINDVFAVTNVDISNNAHDDKFIGLIKFKIITQSPVPSFGQPALE